MAGDVGLDTLLAEGGRGLCLPADWFALRARLRDVPADADLTAILDPAAEPDERLLRAWIADGCPRRAGRAYADFLFELDAWSEYWDLYHPETKGRFHFGDGTEPGYLGAFLPTPGGPRSPTFDAWKRMALTPPHEAWAPALRGTFEERAREPSVAAAAMAVDELVRGLVREHFAGPGGELDGEAYLDAMERFAHDTLPACPERTAALAPDDSRVPFSDSHRMAGDIMWFGWAIHLECAQLVAPPSDQERAERALCMAGIALGSSMDFAFSGRCRTRAEYESADTAAWRRIWERARECAADFDRAAAEVRQLFFIRAYGDG